MNIFKAYKRNDDLIVKGARMVVGETDEGKEIAFRIARAHESYEVFQNAVQSNLQAKKRTLDALSKTDKSAESKLRSELVLGAFVETCIKGWENVTDADGKEFPYNEESLQTLATKLPELIEDLFKFGNDDKNYVGEFDEDGALKN